MAAKLVSWLLKYEAFCQGNVKFGADANQWQLAVAVGSRFISDFPVEELFPIFIIAIPVTSCFSAHIGLIVISAFFLKRGNNGFERGVFFMIQELCFEDISDA